jgi:hypothetical protein
MRHKNKTRITIRINPPTPAMIAIISSLLKVLLDLPLSTGGFHDPTGIKITNVYHVIKRVLLVIFPGVHRYSFAGKWKEAYTWSAISCPSCRQTFWKCF